jgi:hypothetical protein
MNKSIDMHKRVRVAECVRYPNPQKMPAKERTLLEWAISVFWLIVILTTLVMGSALSLHLARLATS